MVYFISYRLLNISYDILLVLTMFFIPIVDLHPLKQFMKSARVTREATNEIRVDICLHSEFS